MAVVTQMPKAPGRVLSTLNEDGSRRWIRPRPSPGRWWRWRRAVAYALMLVFFAIPYLRIGGKPPILLDLPAREFTLFGTTFLPTDTLLFMLLFVSAGILVFLVTTLFGRVWCGWGCPQTVYLEFLFRPLERALEAGFRGSLRLDRRRAPAAARLVKHAIYVVLAMFLAHTFLAYFVGIDRLVLWVQGSPHQHPVAFAVMAGTTLAIFLDFAWYREQTCLVACPYGRLQSVLFDRSTLVVAYDPARGEPRMHGRPRPAGSGDCIDCGSCVRTCPTGIDIRDGLQMECVHCTQCIDACDQIMANMQMRPGLIRYASRDELEGRRRRALRARVVLYPLALCVSLGLFVFFLENRATTEVTLLRGTGALYQAYDEHAVVGEVRVKLSNRNRDARQYRLALVGGGEGTRLIAPLNPFPVPGGHTLTATVFVVSPRSAFADGHRRVVFRIDDGHGFARSYLHPLTGPEEHEGHDGHGGREHEDRGPARDGRDRR